jgi:hypothetical protein
MTSPLVGLTEIQKSYLDSLSTNVAINGSTAGMVADLEARLNKMNTNYNTASQNVNDVLTKQKEMQDIVNKEQARLLQKKTTVDDTFNGKLRGSQLNESYRQKRAAYMKILIAISLSLIVYLIIYFVLKTFLLPEGVGNMLSILLFSVTILYVLSVVTEIYKRDNLDYSTLNIPPPKMAKPVGASGNLTDVSGNNLTDANLCIGKDCCDPLISVWKPYVNQCINKKINECKSGESYLIAQNRCIPSGTCATRHDGSICGKACIPKIQTCYASTEKFSNLGSIIHPFNTDLVKFAFV